MGQPQGEQSPPPAILPPVSIPKDGIEYEPTPTPPSRALSPDEYRRRVVVVAALRHAGYTYDDIEKETGLRREQIRYALVKAREMDLRTMEVAHRLDNVAIPLAVENLIDILEDPAHPSHYKATRDTLYGRGEFRNHSHSVSDNRNVNLNLTVEYEMPGGAPIPDVVQLTEDRGLIVGTPRQDAPADGAGEPR